MPISAEQKTLYPPDWQEIRARILVRANGRCERCGAVNYEPHPITGSRVVLTIAHLDHDPTNCADDNLLALCQRDHLAYDLKHHQRNARITRRQRKACADLFEATCPS